MSPDAVDRLEAALLDATRRFEEQNPASKALHEDATNALPGGNTRTILHTSPFPLYMKSGKGFQVVSEDGQTYDYLPVVNDLFDWHINIRIQIYRSDGRVYCCSIRAL